MIPPLTMGRERRIGEAIELPESSANPLSSAHDTIATEPLPERAIRLKMISSGFSFFVAGVNDGSLGALIPYFMVSYRINSSSVTTM